MQDYHSAVIGSSQLECPGNTTTLEVYQPLDKRINMKQRISVARSVFLQKIRKSSALLFPFLLVQFTFQGIGQKLTIIDSLENVLHKSLNDKEKVDVLNVLSHELNLQWEMDKAMRYAEEALSLSGKALYKKGKADAYSIIGNIYFQKSNYPEAIKNYSASLKIREEIGDNVAIVSEYLMIGNVYGQEGNYPESQKNLEKAKSLGERIGADKLTIAYCYSSIGNICCIKGNYTEALKNYLTALRLREEAGDKKGMASSYDNIGTVYSYMGNNSDALKYMLSGLKVMEEIGNNHGIARAYTNIGTIYLDIHNYPEALRNFLSSIKIMEMFDDRSGLSDVYINIGSVYFNLDNFPEAMSNYLAARKIGEELGNNSTVAYTNTLIGAVYRKQNQFKDARISLETGLAQLKEIGLKYEIRECYGYLVELDSAEGNFAQALADYKLMVLYKDSLFNEESNDHVSQLKLQYETEKKDREIELLNRENSLKTLRFEQQQVTLLASELELDNKQLQLARTQEELNNQRLEAKAQAAGMALITKENELKEQQLVKQRLLHNGMIIGMLFLLLLLYLVFRSWQLRKKLEKQRAIIHERGRISADLHDDIGSGLSQISLLSELVRQEAKTPQAKKEAEKIIVTSKMLLESIDEIIWALNANNDYIDNLVLFIRRYAVEYFENSIISLKIDIPENIPQKPISGEYRRNIYFAAKEAMHNIIKHSDASLAEIRFSLENGLFSVFIADNGKGIPRSELNRFGNGIMNMRNRMKNIHGSITIENHAGTKITLALPV